MGLISKVKKQSAEILVFTDTGPWIIRDCRFRYDPRVAEHPEWLSTDPRSRALFEPNDNDTQYQRIEDDMKTMFSVLEQQAKELTELQDAVQRLIRADRQPEKTGRKTPSRKPMPVEV